MRFTWVPWGRKTPGRAARLRDTAEFGLTERDVARLHGPVGLSIGSRTPPEIAVAILAELDRRAIDWGCRPRRKVARLRTPRERRHSPCSRFGDALRLAETARAPPARRARGGSHCAPVARVVHARRRRDGYGQRCAYLSHEAGCEVIVNPARRAGHGHLRFACGSHTRARLRRGSLRWATCRSFAAARWPAFNRQAASTRTSWCRNSINCVAIPYAFRGRGRRSPALNGDRGARALFEKHASRLLVWPTDDSGVLADIDTPDDLAGVANGRG